MRVTLGGTVYDGVTADFAKYDSNRSATAIRLWVDEGYGPELLAAATVNIQGVTPAMGCVLLKDYSENEGMLKSLMGLGLVRPTGRVFKTGWVEVPEVRLIGEWEGKA